MRRGEIWWHEPPDERPRPVLVLTRDDEVPHAFDLIAMPASRTQHGWMTEVEVGPEDGMPTTSYLIAENILSAGKIYLTRRITELGAAKVDAVCRALAAATHCG